MYMNIAALLLLLGITWIWLNRGFFSSMIHMVCTIAAGAIAFAFWEPLSMLLIGLAPDSGFLSVLSFIAWGAGLMLPFGASLLILRAIADSVIGMNVKPLKLVDYAGGGVCGFVSGAITTGIVVIGVGYLPMGTGFLGYRPINYSESGSGSGSLGRAGGLWIPVERATAGFYGQLSKTTLSTGRPLADWHPDLDMGGYAINTSAAGGKARPALKPEHFRILKTYTVGEADGSDRMNDLLIENDSSDALVQPYLDIEGEPVPAGTLFGIVMEFKDGAKESNGQVVMGNGQAKLIMHNHAGEAIVAHPIALISQADSSNANLYARWMYDAEEVFIASVGGSATATMAFEFVMPTGYTPQAVVIKNSRLLLGGEPDAQFQTPSARFAAVSGGSLVGGVTISDIDTSGAASVDSTVISGRRQAGDSPVFAGNSLGFTFEVRQKGSLTLDGENRVVRGKAKFRPEDVNNRSVDRNVLVNRIAGDSDVVLVKVNVSPDTPASLLGRVARSVDRVLPPQLIDTNGTVYPAVGYIYEDNEIIELSYDPAQPIRGTATLPSLSSSRSDQQLTLVFRCSKGVELDYYALGPKVIVELNPPLLLD